MIPQSAASSNLVGFLEDITAVVPLPPSDTRRIVLPTVRIILSVVTVSKFDGVGLAVLLRSHSSQRISKGSTGKDLDGPDGKCRLTAFRPRIFDGRFSDVDMPHFNLKSFEYLDWQEDFDSLDFGSTLQLLVLCEKP